MTREFTFELQPGQTLKITRVPPPSDAALDEMFSHCEKAHDLSLTMDERKMFERLAHLSDYVKALRLEARRIMENEDGRDYITDFMMKVACYPDDVHPEIGDAPDAKTD
jgi:hypothetical protein